MSDLFPHLAKLQGFLAIAREGSFHRAARSLRMSQPSLSQSMQVLEEIVGESLLVRSPRGATLTAAGQIVLQLANRIEGGLLGLKSALAAGTRAVGKHLRVGVYESAAIYIWPATLRLLKEELANLEVSLVTGRSGELMQGLREGALDAALVIEPDDDPTLVIKTVYSDQFGFYVSPALLPSFEDRSKGKPRLAREVLTTTPLILFHSARINRAERLEDVVVAQGVDRRHLLRVESFEVAKEFCRQGLGLALLPTRVAARATDEGTLVRIHVADLADRDFGRHRFCYCYRADHWEVSTIRSLGKLVRRAT